MVLLRLANRVIIWIRGLAQRNARRRYSGQHGSAGRGDGGEVGEDHLESNSSAASRQSEDASAEGGVIQECLHHVQLDMQLPIDGFASIESLLPPTAAPPMLDRSPAMAVPGVTLARENLSGAAKTTHSSQERSHATNKPLPEGTPDNDEEIVCTEPDLLDAERKAENMDSGHFRQGSFSLSLSQIQVSKAYVGVVRTRFPPEPNGPLHLGHAKAIHINFSVARKYGGECILRFDDTNPKTARQTYCDEAFEMVLWLGYWPASVSYTSDYFDKLIVSAYQLIVEGAAFVCHQRQAVGSHGHGVAESPWRNRSVEENMREFQKMCLGGYSEGETVLRLKVRTCSGMRDPVAYRICNTEHYRTGRRWCIYPTYDFSHPIIDSLEGIAVSLCSAEFAGHRALYQWIHRKIGLYRVPQREFQRLEVRDCILSKRRLIGCLNTCFHTYDDPRLATLAGLRRRGIPPEAVRMFVREGYREYEQLLDITREVLLQQAKHCMVVLKPLTCRVINYNEVTTAEGMAGQPWVSLQVPECQAGPNNLGHPVILSSVIYINKFDFHLREPRHCFTPRSPVHLRGTCYVMQFSSMARNNEGDVVGLQVVLRKVEGSVRSMKVLTWVSDPVTVTINYLDSLAKSKASPESPIPPVYSAAAFIEAGPFNALRLGRFFTYGQTLQAERFAYITLDPTPPSSSCRDEPVFNVTCLLRLHPRFRDSILQVFKPSYPPPPPQPSPPSIT